MVARGHAVIQIDAAWLAVEPLDMRAGTDTALARVVKVLGAAPSHHGYVFVNKDAIHIKVLVAPSTLRFDVQLSYRSS
jgi:transposase